MKADIKYPITILLNLNHVVNIPTTKIPLFCSISFGSLEVGPLGPLALFCKVRALLLLLVKVG